jgi:hypothetical protein
VVAPDGVRPHRQPEWVDRSGPRGEQARLPPGQQERQARAETSGADGLQLLTASDTAPHATWLAGGPQGRRCARSGPSSSTSVRASPAGARATSWRPLPSSSTPPTILTPALARHDLGGLPLTQTCEPEAPQLMTPGATTSATTAEVALIRPLHDALKRNRLLPAPPRVDAG